MKLEIKTVPAVYTYAFYCSMMMVFALTPFLWERQGFQILMLSGLLCAVTFLLGHSVKRYFSDVKSVSISLSSGEFTGGLLIVLGAIAAGVYVA